MAELEEQDSGSDRVSKNKSTVVASTASASAQVGQRVVIFSSDLQRRGVHRFLDLDNATGLADALTVEDSSPVPNGIVKQTPVSTCGCMLAGSLDSRTGRG